MKKIFITMLVAATLCIFLAFTVSAEEYDLVDNLGDPDWYTGDYQLMTDKEAKVVLSNGDGTYTAYPSYYILKYKLTVADGAITEAKLSGFDYSFVNSKTGKNYQSGAVYKIELPEGLTKYESGYIGYQPKEANAVEIVLSDSITEIGDHAFRGSKTLERIVLPKNLEKMGAYVFYECTAIEEVVFTSGSDKPLDLSKAYTFYKCTSLKELDISQRNVSVLGSHFLSECTNVEMVSLPDTITEFTSQTFYNNPKMYLASGFLPTSLKRMGFHSFSGCKSINSVLYFPEGFEGFTGTYIFSSDKSYPADLTLVFLGEMSGTLALQQAHTNNGRKLTLIFTKNTFSDLTGKFVSASTDGTLTYTGVTASTDDKNYVEQAGTLELILGNPSDSSKYGVDGNGNTLYYVNSKSARIFFCGGDNVELCYDVRTTAVEGSHANYITTPFVFDRAGHMDGGVHYDLTRVESLANCGVDGVTLHTCVLCDRVEKDVIPATGDHTVYEVSPCADKCEVCLQYVQKATQSHVIVEYFAYENGYMNEGEYGEVCTNEGCNCKTAETKDALVCDLGYSVPEGEGLIGITYGYKANKEVVADYERVNGCQVGLGVLIATGENFQKDEKIFEHRFSVILDCVDVVVNYGDRTDLNDCELVISAVLYQTKDNQTVKTCLQGETNRITTDYTSQQYGTLYGISFNSIKQ